ncbi:mandelate racemase [Phreatobacter aquaticus]|uniref:Mandelate racemase n=1 Tax=Phreatobacter aquaticus TaxID=2570229 RepID=A0A4D7QCJ5_9HYPH|nr:mandelate racemase [Phreatobacter aquaticus]QCK84898.1 mandelate racemase [Phreatobacter aquaticus]
MTAPKVKVLSVELFERPYKLRMPFRFGVITVTHGIQAVTRVRIRHQDGREEFGHAAEALGAKWFDKDKTLSDDQNLDQLRRALEIATAAYLVAAPSTAFGLFADGYRGQIAAGAQERLNPLVASYGPALLDRAVLDALCRLENVSFYEAIRTNLPGIGHHPIIADLDGFDLAGFLAGLSPQAGIDVRHTVGLVDPIVAADQAPGTRVDDGLPETLEEVVSFYGCRWYKLKVAGDVPSDIARLEKIAAVLDRIPGGYRATLDGNEQYETAEAFAPLWQAIQARPSLAKLWEAIVLIEQPIARHAALSQPLGAAAPPKPVIIDESDGDLDAFPRARALGYHGVSSKVCKGLYKSILNLARCRMWNGGADGPYFMSGEDLTTQMGASIQQDLALVSLLGITHVERNAHHFIDGFDERPETEARAHLAAHPDLYRDDHGRVRLAIVEGRLAIGSLDRPGFAASPPPDVSVLAPMRKSGWDG